MSLPIFRQKAEMIFGLLLLLHCSSIGIGWQLLSVITKLLLVPYLIFLLYFFSENRQQPVHPYCILALLFSFIGDLALSFSSELSFLVGMGAFMVAHICNAGYFRKLQKNSPVSVRTRILAATGMFVVSAALFMLLAPHLGTLAYPILLYMCLISIMTVLAIGTAEAEPVKMIGKYCFIPGAFLFVLSDSVLALNRFILHNTGMAVVVMLTYGMAQFFLVRGYMRVTAADL